MTLRESPLRYFVGGVPPRTVYANHVVRLLEISNRIPPEARDRSQEWEVCFIALIAYFEAFCKDLFACVVNIRPELLNRLREAGRDTAIDAADLVAQGEFSSFRVGSLLAERIDLGTAKKVNATYSALLNFAPFGKKDSADFDRFLSVRNQLVHHGGIVTSRFARQSERQVAAENVYMHSLVLTARFFGDAYNLFMKVSGQMVQLAKRRIEEFAAEQHLSVSPDQQQAVEWLINWELPGG
jgi:hypothetical protein